VPAAGQPVYVSAGSNIDPVENLRLAGRELEKVFGELSMSSVYQTAPVGMQGDDFLNMVIRFSTGQSVDGIVTELERIETVAGRDRQPERFSPRVLDLDLLLYGDRVSDGPPAQLPRADLTDYAFVLQPMAELAPDLAHPVTGESMRELWSRFDQTEQMTRRLCGLYQPTLRPPSTAMI
jgi:2-amino-4-hydroxy-6-hydroxymethyldihydropteridine diphosphokinase